MDMARDAPAYSEYMWIGHLAATGALVLSGLYLVSTPDERNIGLIVLGFAVLGFMLALGPFRQRERFAWTAMWVYPSTFLAVGLLTTLVGGRMDVGLYYGALGVIQLAAQLLSAPLFAKS